MKKEYKRQAIIEDIMRGSTDELKTVSPAEAQYHSYDAVCRHLINNEKVMASLSELDSFVAYQNTMEGSPHKVFIKRALRKLTFWFINPIVCSQKCLIDKTRQFFSNVNTLLCMFKDNIFKHNEQINELTLKVNELKEQLNAQKEQVAQLSGEMEAARSHIQYIKENGSTIDQIIYDHNEDGLVDYFDFENKFRGSEQEIKSRVERYPQYFPKDGLVMDIGCGRGEMLEVLSAAGYNCMGIDVYTPFVEYCQNKGLNVEKIDGISKLRSLEDNTLAGITCIQVIEHLTNRYLIDMINLCHAKLRKDGVIIFETQNVKTLYTLARHFYVDLDHKKPVHPTALEYILKSKGFEIVAVDYPDYSLIKSGFVPHVESEHMNQQIDIANDLLYGPTDYAMIARKI